MEKSTAQETTKEQRRQSTTRYLKLKRLPTLQEVLDRRTRPPLDLFCFYVGVAPDIPIVVCGDWLIGLQIFLQRESSEDALDFWLDVQQHENMCKAYFKVSNMAFGMTPRECLNICSDNPRTFENQVDPSRMTGQNSQPMHGPTAPTSRRCSTFHL